mmetsp:Transcript_54377/g.140459  ORF Transcript_54377/g.140459 Transcript_54377/m.140459 type:complete len:149 (-) Transcript_54377:131-577(-)
MMCPHLAQLLLSFSPARRRQVLAVVVHVSTVQARGSASLKRLLLPEVGDVLQEWRVAEARPNGAVRAVQLLASRPRVCSQLLRRGEKINLCKARPPADIKRARMVICLHVVTCMPPPIPLTAPGIHNWVRHAMRDSEEPITPGCVLQS